MTHTAGVPQVGWTASPTSHQDVIREVQKVVRLDGWGDPAADVVDHGESLYFFIRLWVNINIY